MDVCENEHFDTVIIGAGMSGLAAGIRLAMFGREVIVLERHNAPGGLNSFYSFGGNKFDVGLHAVTNYVPPGTKGTPLGKLCRQLRIDRESFGLCEQFGSRIVFPGIDLAFTNDFSCLETDIAKKLPAQIDRFRKLLSVIKAFDELDYNAAKLSTRHILGEHLSDPLLIEMLLCPLMYYGSAEENDMDFGQFVIMFKSIFCEGFSRPFEGVRHIIRTLLQRFRAVGGKRKMKCGVKQLVAQDGRVSRIVLDDGRTLTADHVISSAGLVETLRLCSDLTIEAGKESVGRLSFVETITLLDCQPRELGWKDTIVFFNDHDRFIYERPDERVDPRSGVICFPNNYQYDDSRELVDGVFRVTAMANYNRWVNLDQAEYLREKQFWYNHLMSQALRQLPDLPGGGRTIRKATREMDMFTPRTVEKFTSHLGGAVYGSPDKVKDGRTHLSNLFLCGTDQGFLGIIGAMLSGISMANYHILSPPR